MAISVSQVFQTSKEKLPGQKGDFAGKFLAGKTPMDCLAKLKEFQSYSDALVSDKNSLLQQSLSGNENFKARGCAIVQISGLLQSMVYDGVINDPALIDQINFFKCRKWNALYDKSEGRFTTGDELRYINTMLDAVVEHLKTTYRLN